MCFFVRCCGANQLISDGSLGLVNQILTYNLTFGYKWPRTPLHADSWRLLARTCGRSRGADDRAGRKFYVEKEPLKLNQRNTRSGAWTSSAVAVGGVEWQTTKYNPPSSSSSSSSSGAAAIAASEAVNFIMTWWRACIQTRPLKLDARRRRRLGASRYDIRKLFGFFDPSPRTHLELIC